MTPSLLPMPACCSAVFSIISAATSTRPPAPTTAASALPIPPTPPASRPSPFTPAASSSTPLLWTIPQPTRRILRSLLRSRPLRPRHPQRLLRSKNSPGVSPTTESFQSLSHCTSPALSSRPLFLSRNTRLLTNEDPAFPVLLLPVKMARTFHVLQITVYT